MSNLKIIAIIMIISLLSCTEDNQSEPLDICDKNDISSSKLISVAEAQRDLERTENYIPVEVTKVDEFFRGHIPGAVNVWRPDFRTKIASKFKGMICSSAELNLFLRSLGTHDDSTLLIYDNKGGCDAMRLAWVFDFYGFDKYKVINGGKAAWLQAALPLDSTETEIIQDDVYVFEGKPDSSFYATKKEVLAAISDTNTVIIDTREPYEFLGEPFIASDKVHEYKSGAFTRGSIPGSIHLNWSDFSDLGDDHRIKCTKDLQHDLAQKNIDPSKKIIVYCQSGSRSSHTAFVLREILKFPHVKNYDGSWIEWSYFHKLDGSTPIEVHTDDVRFRELKGKLFVQPRNYTNSVLEFHIFSSLLKQLLR